MLEPKISVIVPVYRVEAFLKKCIDSILAQTFRDLEVILVDDGSPDSCGAVCDEYAVRDARVRVIHQANGGLGAARNAGLDIACGDFIGFVDSDDWIEPTMYEDMLRFMQEEDLDIVFCAANVVENGQVVDVISRYYPDRSVIDRRTVLRQALTDQIKSYFPFKLFRRQCWDGLRFPTERLFEDIAISFRPFLNTERPVGFLDKPLYNYVKNADGLTYRRKPLTLYHIFLGDLEHFRYAARECPEALAECASLTARFALGTVADCYCCGFSELAPYVHEAEDFLNENRACLRSNTLSRFWRIALKLYYCSEQLFILTYRAFVLLRGKGRNHA